MSWWETLGAALAALGIKAAVLASSAVGGFLSLRFFEGAPQPDGTTKALSVTEKWGIAGSGTALGIFLSGAMLEFFSIPDRSGKVEVGLAIIIALFGMSVAASLIRALRELNLAAVLKSWLERR